MKQINITGLFILLVFGMFIIVSCKKHPENTQTDYNRELQAVNSYMYPQQFTNQFMLSFFKSLYDSSLINGEIITLDSAKTIMKNENDTLTIQMEYWSDDINLWHHIDSYRHFRCGTYRFVADSLFLQSDTGSVTIEVVKPFYYDSLTVNIENIKIAKTGKTDGNQTFRVLFENMVMDGTYAGKFTWKFNADFTYVLYKDETTPYLSPDDYYLFSGTMSGNTPVDIGYGIKISPDTSRYKINYNCFYTIEGKSVLEMHGVGINNNVSYIDFIKEDGCNNQYEVTFPEQMTTKGSIE